MAVGSSLFFKKELGDIEREDLIHVEKDLKYFEKVSITFLLFGDLEKQHILYALQKLMTMYNSKEDESQILYEYAGIAGGDHWKLRIVEALAIIKVHKVVRLLGFKKEDVREVLLPHVPEIGVTIHPILKTLYTICEGLTTVQTGRLLHSLNKESTLRFYDEVYFEVFLLDWISKDIISIGDVFKKMPPNLDLLIEYFKFNDHIVLYELVLSSLNKFNENFRLRSRNVNDSALTMLSMDVSRSKSFDRKESIDLSELDMSYRISHETAGYILIINQMEFHRETDENLKELLPTQELPTRIGSEVDEICLKETFSMFGYKTVVKNNLKHNEIVSTVSDFAARSIAYDSLIVCILSHGAKGTIFGSNSIPVAISKIEEVITVDSLLNKPKILIVQACQGTELQEAKAISSDEETDGGGATAATLSDMLVLMSTVPGYASIRHKVNGTWFIQSLCKHVRNFGEKKHIYDILTIVNQDVQRKRGSDNKCMVPIFSSTLGKYLYLPKIK